MCACGFAAPKDEGMSLPVVAAYPADVAACRAILAEGSKSFNAASWLLPARVRDPAAIFYAFCRVADDLVDESGDPHGAVVILNRRLDAVWSKSPDSDPVDRSLAAIVEAYALPRTVFDALIEGFVWDAEGRAYESFEDVLDYCARVASTVGVIMTLLMGRREPNTLARACDLGAAMQLTNICRDVAEDAGRGRLYLPAEWMREAGLDPDRFVRSPSASDELSSVVRRVLDEADRLYARAETGVLDLPPDSRASIRAARLIYAAIGDVLRARGCDPMRGRARTSLLRKLWLLARARFRSTTAEAVDPSPPLRATAFLVEAVSPSGDASATAT